jgi:L-fuculose-phosphate aldolase
MLMKESREKIAEYGRRMVQDHLTTGTSGNISLYDPQSGRMAIKPSGMAYDAIHAADVVVMDLQGHIIEGKRKPSSEYTLHALMYQLDPSIRAVVHTHSMYCTVYACLRQPIRALHYLIADLGADHIPCAEYATYGTQALAENVAKAKTEAKAILLANHGLVTFDTSLESAYRNAKNTEWLAELQYRAESIGKPYILSEKEIDTVMQSFKTYGQ